MPLRTIPVLLYLKKIDGGYLFGSDPTYHGTLYSIYSQSDATQRLLLSWCALLAIVFVLGCAVSVFLKRKDARK